MDAHLQRIGNMQTLLKARPEGDSRILEWQIRLRVEYDALAEAVAKHNAKAKDEHCASAARSWASHAKIHNARVEAEAKRLKYDPQNPGRLCYLPLELPHDGMHFNWQSAYPVLRKTQGYEELSVVMGKNEFYDLPRIATKLKPLDLPRKPDFIGKPVPSYFFAGGAENSSSESEESESEEADSFVVSDEDSLSLFYSSDENKGPKRRLVLSEASEEDESEDEDLTRKKKRKILSSDEGGSPKRRIIVDSDEETL
jgi:hypothetical protein